MKKRHGSEKEKREQDIDKEQRRNTRSGAIIAIIAVVGVMCSFLIKLTTRMLSIWQLEGIIYGYMQVLFSCALATGILIFGDIGIYVIWDLKRYDVLDESYAQYDDISDKKYLNLWNDFKIYMLMLTVLVILLIPIAGITERPERIGSYFFSITFILLGIFGCVRWLWSNERKVICEGIRNLISHFVSWIVTAAVCWLVCIIIVLAMNSTSQIKIEYIDDGIVEICNSSSRDYDTMYIEIQSDEGSVVYVEKVQKKDLLFAYEEKYIDNQAEGRNSVRGAMLDGERVYWKYDLDLRKAVRNSGEYSIWITVCENKKQVKLLNSFKIENGRFEFALSLMEKEY